MAHGRTISVWFFIGVLLLIYGVLILGSGLAGIGTPTPGVVMGDLHVDIWWGALLVLIGGFYSFAFRPGKG
jgi:hypothetical protein